MTNPPDNSSKPTLDEILEPIASGWRSWTHDQLDGTSFIKDELDEIERTKAEAKQQLAQLIAEIIGEDVEAPHVIEKTEFEMAINWHAHGDNSLRAEQRQRAKERGIDLEAGDAK